MTADHAPDVPTLLAVDTAHADDTQTLIDFDAWRATAWATRDTLSATARRES